MPLPLLLCWLSVLYCIIEDLCKLLLLFIMSHIYHTGQVGKWSTIHIFLSFIWQNLHECFCISSPSWPSLYASMLQTGDLGQPVNFQSVQLYEWVLDTLCHGENTSQRTEYLPVPPDHAVLNGPSTTLCFMHDSLPHQIWGFPWVTKAEQEREKILPLYTWCTITVNVQLKIL